MRTHVLILGKVWPEPSSSAAGRRMLQLMDTFLSQGWRVSFASAARRSEYSVLPDTDELNAFSIELNSSGFDDLLKELQPSIILFDRFSTEEQFGWRAALHCPGAIRLLDTEDLHCLRAGRQKAMEESRPFEQTDLVNDVAKRELASIYRCDLSLIISRYEMQLLQDFFKVDPALLHYIPFLPDPVTAEQVRSWPSFSGRKNFASIGNFLHAPNWDATLFLKQSIWPLIREQLPQAVMEVYGAYPTQKVFHLHDPAKGFIIKGRAEHVSQVLSQARLCLAPLRFGAGLKGKLLDSMYYGAPSVTTSIGAEGMYEGSGWNGAIADQPSDFAAAAVELYGDESLWNKAQQQGAHLYNTLFDSKGHKQNLINVLLALQTELEAHRYKNFTGAMLFHHSLLSTKYMALWIEAKNKVSNE